MLQKILCTHFENNIYVKEVISEATKYILWYNSRDMYKQIFKVIKILARIDISNHITNYLDFSNFNTNARKLTARGYTCSMKHQLESKD